MGAKDVQITLQGSIPIATPDPITLGRGQGHTINWHNGLSESVTITFDNGSPFDGGHPYEIAAGGQGHSGAIRVQAGPNPWKYTIKTASGIVNDPQVIIEP